MSETAAVNEDDTKIRTSEIIAQGGMMEVGDSTARMNIRNEAEKKGKLVNDGDASDHFADTIKRLSGKITSWIRN